MIPKLFLRGGYDCDEANLQGAWDAGYRFISYDQYGFNGDSEAAANSYEATRRNLRDKNGNVVALPIYLVPGLKANNTFLPDVRDRTSWALRALQDPTVLGFAFDDEAGTWDRRTTSNPSGPFGPRQTPADMLALKTYVDAVAAAHNIPSKDWWFNDGNLMYWNASHSAYWQSGAFRIGSSDYYPVSIGQTILAGSRVDGHEFTATQGGISTYYAVKRAIDPITGTANAFFGQHYIGFGQQGSIGDKPDGSPGPTPTLAQSYVLDWDQIINGAGGLCEFVTHTNPFTGWNYNKMYTPYNAESQQWVDILQARGHMMAVAGGRTPSDTRHSPLADTGSGSVLVPDLYTGPWVTISDGTKQIQGGFTSAKFYSEDKSTWTTVILLMTGVDTVLNDTIAGGYGITGMMFPAVKPVKAFASTDTKFEHDLFAVVDWRTQLRGLLAKLGTTSADLNVLAIATARLLATS